MRWIGQNIYDLISRFRNDVYLEASVNPASDVDKFLVQSSDGKVGFRTGAEVLSDIGVPTITTLASVSAIGSAGTPITVTSDAVTFTSASADDPLIKIQNTTDNDQGARLFLWKARTDGSIQGGEADDEIGALYFYGYDSASNLQGYGRIETFIDVATDGQESGIMQIGVASHDGGFNNGLYMKGGSVDTEVDVTVASGASSVTTIAGTLTMGSTAAMTNAGLLSVANQSNVTGLGTISSGVWQGTTIKTAYIGDDQVTEDKLANTLLAEIDANTAKVTRHTLIDSDAFTGASSSNVASAESIKAYADTKVASDAQKQLTYYFMQADIDTTKTYIGLQEADGESTSSTNKNLPILAPFAGKLLKVFLRASGNLSGKTLTWRLETQAAGSTTLAAPTVVGTQSGAGCTNATMTTYDFTSSLDSGDNIIDAGDTVQLSVQSDGTTNNTKYYITCLWEWDLS